MSDQEFFGVTVNAVNGKTYWQAGASKRGGFISKAELINHVKRYSKGPKHIVVYTEDNQRELVFVEHLNAGTY
jgi:hypothetical protein